MAFLCPFIEDDGFTRTSIDLPPAIEFSPDSENLLDEEETSMSLGGPSQSSTTSTESGGRTSPRITQAAEVMGSLMQVVSRIETITAASDDIKYFCVSQENMLRIMPKETRISLYIAWYEFAARHWSSKSS